MGDNERKAQASLKDAELINQQTIVDGSKGKLVQTYSFEIKINNRNGDKYAEVSILLQVLLSIAINLTL